MPSWPRKPKRFAAARLALAIHRIRMSVPICLGLPGALPALNRRALELAARASLALDCRVEEHSRFARKNYFYPDLPKGYQISMYELPLAVDGQLQIEFEGANKHIGITRLHMEEDAAKRCTKASRTRIEIYLH